jgi:hypothetical protein
MSDLTTAEAVLDALLAGTPIDELEPHLQQLASQERQTVLCTACFILDEVRANCPERADEIVEILERDCGSYCSGKKTCMPKGQ